MKFWSIRFLFRPDLQNDTVNSKLLDVVLRYSFVSEGSDASRLFRLCASLCFSLPDLHFSLSASASFRFDLGYEKVFHSSCLPRKEVIQPHLPIRLPCYDFTPVISPTLNGCSLAVSSPALGVTNSHGVTGGVYKARERIHRDILIRDY